MGRGWGCEMKYLFTGLLILLAFGAGYLAGGREQQMVQQSLEQVKNDMARKTLDLERHLKKARLRGHLLEMRDALALAQTHIQHQDFGMAKAAVLQARQSLQAALHLGEGNEIARLQPLDRELGRLADALLRLGPRAAQEIERLKERIVLTGEQG